MKRITDGWVLISQRPDAARQPFAAQPKVYFNDGTAQLLHVHSGETKQEAESKARVELEQYMTQHG